MSTDESDDQREIRAARNQALFRAINERMKELQEAFSVFSGAFTIACECADAKCLEMITIDPEEYERIRANPRRFAVLFDHVRFDVEDVVSDHATYVVAEKHAGPVGTVVEAVDRLDRSTRAGP